VAPRLSTEVLRFRRSETEEVEARLRRLQATGEGWLNLQPVVDDVGLAEGSFGMMRVLSSRGPRIPLGTFVPAGRGRRPSPASLGLEHPAGPRALERLTELGIHRPSGSVKRQDHAKRGIVVELPDDVDASTVVRFLVDAATALAGVPVGEWWIATIHAPAAGGEPGRG
jgi:hypothetical protein